MLYWIVCALLLGALAIWAVSRAKQSAWRNSHPAVGKFVEIDGKRLHYVKSGNGPPLIALHGAGGNLRDYTFSLMDQMSEHFTVYAFDRPSHGYSDVFDSRGETLEMQARIIVKAAQSIGIDQASVIGYSFGGSVAMAMALDQPEFVSDLTLVAAPIHTWPDDSVSATYRLAALPVIGPAIMHTAYAILPQSYFTNAYQQVFTPQSAPDGFIDHVGIGLTMKPRTFVNNSRQVVALAPQIKQMIQRYHQLDLPIEIIHGTADLSVSSEYHTRDFMSEFGNPKFNATYVDGMGHGILQLSQREIIDALKRLSK